MDTMVKRFYEHAQSRVVSLRVAKDSELRKMIYKFTDEVEAKDLKL